MFDISLLTLVSWQIWA